MINVDLRNEETEQDRLNMVAEAMENWARRLRAGEKDLLGSIEVRSCAFEEQATSEDFKAHVEKLGSGKLSKTTLVFNQSLLHAMGGINVTGCSEREFWAWLHGAFFPEDCTPRRADPESELPGPR